MLHDPRDSDGCSIEAKRLQGLGELVERSGLCDLVGDDLTALFGSFLEIADRVHEFTAQGADAGRLIDRWRRGGRSAFRVGHTEALIEREHQISCNPASSHYSEVLAEPDAPAPGTRPTAQAAEITCSVCRRTLPLMVAANLVAEIRSAVRERGVVASPSPYRGSAAASPMAAAESDARKVSTQDARLVPHTGRHAAALDRHVGTRIRQWRELREVTQQQLAGAIGVTLQQVSKYERGVSRVSAARLLAVARALDAPLHWFFEGAPE